MDKRSRLLIVDDEYTTLQMVTETLKTDYDVIIAQDGNEAVRKCREEEPDLILMDVMMPNKDGYEACWEIKSDPQFSDLPVIFLTAADDLKNEIQGLEAGGIDYLTKPVNLVLLSMRVANHLEMKKKADLVKAQRDLLQVQKLKLEAALERIKTLEGIIPICQYCKSIRNDQDSWQRLEEYIESNTDARFSHGICDTCKEEHVLKNRKN
ncbi:Response regulator receiver domain-containing protein [Malonomonas rubra DSM 5091]|uniref:Response regulator receiver domain-containing protein n=1 Tax=Malonomonas rubra DSM 5091 TaxID=1122189 RepID=A0A1M6C9L2_MALRU|nr:response regulator [Malonomonas rubra]SHI57707.1 Response regulator receiver domain-containing protein [Malonomonas rubra DSM 5091]